MLTHHGTKRTYVVAPLNQLVDERYTIYWDVAAGGAMSRASASAWVAAIATTLMLAFGCFWWQKHPAGEDRADLWQGGEADNADHAANAAKVPLHAASATASEMPLRPTLASDGVSSPAEAMLQPDAASKAATSAAAAPGTNVAECASGSSTYTRAVSSTSTITPAVADEVHEIAMQRQSVSGHAAGPLRQRHICAGHLSVTSEDSDAADDAAASCGSFELLAAAK